MSALPELPDPAVNPQKARKGFDRVWHATLISLHGLRAGWGEPAFRQEAILSMVMIPAAFWLGRSWVEIAYPGVAYYNEVDRGGHFAAWEEPQLFSEELRATFAPLR